MNKKVTMKHVSSGEVKRHLDAANSIARAEHFIFEARFPWKGAAAAC
jgi:hypothetical protein